MVEHKMPFSKALLWILVSTLLISGSAFMGWLYYLHIRERRLNDDQYRIVAIIQSTPQADALKTVYLAELLHLSLDHPINLYRFKVKEAEQILQSSPLIKKAMVKKILPGTLYIHYQLRTPVAYVGDYANTGIDDEGVLFPFRPFFTPKHLPICYFGLEKEEYHWGSCVKDVPAVKLAFELLQQFADFKQDTLYLKQLDVTQTQADSYGLRQIVMVLEERKNESGSSFSKSLAFLRLSSDHTAQDLANFWNLQTNLFDQEKQVRAKSQERIIDLRIPQLAFIKAGQ